MKENNGNIDFTRGGIYKKLIIFSIPLLLGNLLQQIYYIADSIIVGRLIGSNALAAVGAASSITVLLVYFFQGIASGAGILISQFMGAGQPHKLNKVIKAASIFTVIFGIIFSFTGFFLTEKILYWISVPQDVFHETYLYLAVSFAGMLPMLIYNMGAAMLQAMGDSKTPLYYLLVASVINIVLDIILVKNMGMGVEGTAVATVIAQAVAAVLTFVAIKKNSFKFTKEHINSDDSSILNICKQIAKVGVPIGVQSIVINFSGIIIQNHINGIGSTAMAAWSVFCRIDTFVILPFVSFGIAVTTFMAQNYGARNVKRAFKGVRAGMLLSIVVTLFISVVICVTCPYIFKCFTEETAVIKYACDMIWHMVPLYFMLAMGRIYSSAVSGTGNSVVPMITNITFMCVLRIILIPILTKVVGHNMMTMYYTYWISWIFSLLSIGLYYHIVTKRKMLCYNEG